MPTPRFEINRLLSGQYVLREHPSLDEVADAMAELLRDAGRTLGKFDTEAAAQRAIADRLAAEKSVLQKTG
jgi:hypothetical protein